MLSRTFALLAALAFTFVVAQVSLAADKDAKTHEGKVVKAGANKLTMTDKDGKNEHTHDVPATATVTCDGKACKLEDLKAGTMVKVTMKDDKTVASIEGKTKDK